MEVKWRCGNCSTENKVAVDLEARRGRLIDCPICRRRSSVNYKVTVETTAELLQESIIKEAPRTPSPSDHMGGSNVR